MPRNIKPLTIRRSALASIVAIIATIAVLWWIDAVHIENVQFDNSSENEAAASADPGAERPIQTRRSKPHKDDAESDTRSAPSYMRQDRSGYAISVFEKDVQFFDGERITVRFQPKQSHAHLSLELDNQQDAGFVDRLLPEVEKGNGLAAHRLYKSLLECRGAPRDEAELADYLNQLNQTFSYPDRSVELGTRHLESDQDIVWTESQIRANYERCLGVPSDLTDNATKFLKIAADAKVTGASIEYANSIKSTEPEVAAKYYEEVWQLGDPAGAFGLGRMYRDEKIGSGTDAVTGYAYLYVAQFIVDAFLEGLEGEVYDQIRANQRKRFDQEIKSIRPSEIEMALPVAKKLLQENRNCCLY